MPPPAPLALYIHLPFCRVKCSYCAFAISTRTGLEPEYMSALLREVETRIPEAQPVGSLYLGGGTPSLTSPFALQRLFDALGARIRIEPGAEITLEANPEDVTPSSVRFWRERLGINRLSLGVQSFHDQELIPLGRFHGRDGALAALSLLAEQTDLRTSLDLITGLPGQTVESFVESVEIAIQSGVGHVSIYMLDLEEGSALASRVTQGLIDLPAEEEAVESWLAAREALLDAGFLHYEISNYAKPGEQSRHNLVYWRRDPYVGLGLAAHSFLEGKRQANSRDIGEYVARLSRGDGAIVFEEVLDATMERRERLLLGLRQIEGMTADDFRSLTGDEGEAWKREGLDDGWLRPGAGRIAFTPRGLLLSNELLARLF